MAKASSKRIAASNAAAQRTLRAGFLVANAVHLLLVFGLRRRTRATKSAAAAYVGSEMLALGLWWTLVRMARDGDDLGQAGLTAYMFDIIYVTWFVHVSAALFGAWCWYFWLLIPAYGGFVLYTKLLVPFVFRGADPLRSLLNLVPGLGGGAAGGRGAGPAPAEAAAPQEAQSKRQAKLQKRAEKGDPRIVRR
ncbi:hypothetical protein FA09DRAFT_329713 [Tilletiopsis washingtonensis]|uniref:DUF788-domain-containing protein n=1 Tax=Tilletiopsis washingtonensis TaxID=58919 RepID=A0A316ZCV5_9BASI|nr:hypothetical protein FA09DRAFT_329713 [Tilletiopsis washingtonensis]PWN98073.1 hypothetical protein FA09DRAFT_329713 [Tilletiopsis washingtonensis]